MGLHVQRHLEWLRQREMSANTIRGRAQVLAALARSLDVPLCEAAPWMLAEWRSGLDASSATIVVYVSHVRSFYAWLVATGVLEENPADGLPVPRLGRRLPRPIGEDELFYVYENAPDRIRPWLLLAGWAGLRAVEIAYLRRSCVLEHAMPPVLLIAQDATKGRHERVVPMSTFVAAELAPFLPPAGWVFRRRDGQAGPNTPHQVSARANEYLHSTGITETLHQLRHRFGTASYRVDHDLRAVQELMGHVHPSTTAGYAAFNNADAIATVEALPVPRRLRVVSE